MRYREKVHYVDAWKAPDVITHDSWVRFRVKHALPRWCVGESDGKTGVIIPTRGVKHVAEAGDYIVREEDGSYSACPDSLFHRFYEECEDNDD